MGELFTVGRRVRVRPGATLLSEGDASGRVVLVVSGRFKISTHSADGRETVLGFRGRGDLIGELAAIDGEPHMATATATEPAEIATLTADRFAEELRAHPDAAMDVLRTVVARLRDADRKRAEFAEVPADGRVAARLVELAEEARVAPATLSITQAEIAGWVGCSREAANRALHRFRDDGSVEIGRGKITVLDVERLRRIAGA
jgi:CRP-like cAMP-binding protein